MSFAETLRKNAESALATKIPSGLMAEEEYAAFVDLVGERSIEASKKGLFGVTVCISELARINPKDAKTPIGSWNGSLLAQSIEEKFHVTVTRCTVTDRDDVQHAGYRITW